MPREWNFLILWMTFIACTHVVCQSEEQHDQSIVDFSFNCNDKSIGFYADVEHMCRVFHMCDESGISIPYVCANETAFNQEYRICDWEYNFNCLDSEKWYYLNELTYETDAPETKPPEKQTDQTNSEAS